MEAVIYMLTFADGRKYIGQTVNLKARLIRHATSARQGVNVLVSRAWATMGKPLCEVLCQTDPQSLDEKERHFIALHGTLFPAGLNRETGGNCGQEVCDATKDLHRRANHRRYANPEERERTRQLMLARYSDPNERRKSSDAQFARYADPAARAQASVVMKTVCARPSEQARKSEATRQLWADPVYREKLLAAKLVSSPKGESCSWAKVTEDAVREIRSLRQTGVPIAQVAQTFGLSIGSVSGIANRKTWKHVV